MRNLAGVFGYLITTVLWIAPVASVLADEVSDAMDGLEQRWAEANFITPDKQKEDAFKALIGSAEELTEKYPERAEPKIWEAIIRAGYASAMGGVSAMFKAMPQMKKGRELLLAAEKIDPLAMNGATYTVLGSFYYMVPGGFIGFGDKDKALEYLDKAIEVAPDDLDANYFMGDYLLVMKKYREALPYFEKVLELPEVLKRPVFSEGRKAEAADRLEIVKKRLDIK